MLLRLKSGALWLLAACLLVLPGLGWAEHGQVNLPADAGSITVTSKIEVLADPGGRLTLAEVLQKHAAGAFRTVHGASFSEGFLPHGAAWLHLRLWRPAEAPPRWWLNLDNDSFDAIQLYILHPDGRMESLTVRRETDFAVLLDEAIEDAAEAPHAAPDALDDD